mgnify:CR=1 FL=1
MSSESLNVIALISGGKDSFFSLLQCLENGHRVVALANLYPPDARDTATSQTQIINPGDAIEKPKAQEQDGHVNEKDLNSFMYQTVGHEVIPLYAAATGLPLYRQPILGGAAHHERDYAYDATVENIDETESMIPLLQTIMKNHPEANALCSGAILSTYQRTRVESIALRLGLTPLAYLWKYTVLPSPTALVNDSQLLLDMEAAGLEARIIKVASAGLDEENLWQVASSNAGATRIRNALRKFGIADGAALGEGGEFETIVLNGPFQVFKKAIAVPDDGRTVVREGGGSTWLLLRGAQLKEKDVEEKKTVVKTADLLDVKFQHIMVSLSRYAKTKASPTIKASSKLANFIIDKESSLHHWSFRGADGQERTVKEQTEQLVEQIKEKLAASRLDANDITTVVIILRNMADFPNINAEYGKLFSKPNPPSRVTISSGGLLPVGSNIMIHVTVPTSSSHSRDGLHVQSRSYWAPANIGPYSQAIDIPSSRRSGASLRLTYIAGQIPLIPSTMLLPTPSIVSLELQIVLSLQHLWRIGAERSIQYWTSAVAYFAKTTANEEMETNAKLVGQAWRIVHAPVEDEEEAGGPDLWDLKYNPEFMSLTGPEQASKKPPLVDWSIFPLRQQNEPDACIPPLFAVEVEELPRQSAVEWHAHIGLSRVEEGKAEVASFAESADSNWKTWHIIVRENNAAFIHSVVSGREVDGSKLATSLGTAYQASLQNLGVDAAVTQDVPYLAYLDAENWSQVADDAPFAVVPCRSIWAANGPESGKVACVGLFKTILTSE